MCICISLYLIYINNLILYKKKSIHKIIKPDNFVEKKVTCKTNKTRNSEKNIYHSFN